MVPAAYRRLNLARFIESGALGCASPELLAPLSDLVPHQASLLNSLVALREYSAKDASIVTQLSIEIKHRFFIVSLEYCAQFTRFTDAWN